MRLIYLLNESKLISGKKRSFLIFRVLFMTEGRVAYIGTIDGAIPFFSR